jgi:hypothetical protein
VILLFSWQDDLNANRGLDLKYKQAARDLHGWPALREGHLAPRCAIALAIDRLH